MRKATFSGNLRLVNLGQVALQYPILNSKFACIDSAYSPKVVDLKYLTAFYKEPSVARLLGVEIPKDKKVSI